MTYVDPIIEKYINLFTANNGEIKAYYQGEPIRIPSVNLPCVFIAKKETAVGVHNNNDDEHGMRLTITVVADVRSDLSTEDNIASLVAGVSTLYDLVEGRNADYTLKDTSIVHILRHNITLDSGKNLRTDLGTNTRIDYGLTLRDRAPEQWSVEARIDIVASFTQAR